MSRTIDRRKVRKMLLFGGAIAIGLSTASGAAYAQDQVLEEITVTGSRIQRANQVQPNPVYGLDSEEIESTGQLNMIDVVNDLPQLFSSQNSAQSTFFATNTSTGINNTPGLALLDLRALGPNRTLVLVDGRRHVSGQAGSAGVDISTIPTALVERVEVLTGGASAIYGADAVSGVVNFIMKDDYQGTEIALTGGVTSENQAGSEWQLSFTHGQSFMNDRLNVAIHASVRRQGEIKNRDRDWAIDSGIAESSSDNWRQFFQNGDNIPPGAFLGAAIATDDGSGNCVAAFPGTDQSVLDRACAAAPQSIDHNLRFGLTSPAGLVSIALAEDITDPNPERATSFPLFHQEADAADLAPGTPFMDFNNNGVDDCIESFVGEIHVGGCVVTDRDGNVRPFNPGLVDGDINFNAVGGDGSPQTGTDATSLDPQYEQFVLNALISYDITDTTRFFTDLKYVKSTTTAIDGTISFEDTINIANDNPFVPSQLRSLMDNILTLNPQFADTAQFFMSRDPEDVHTDGIYDRETVRAVIGFGGDFFQDWTWEAALNYGQTKEDWRSRSLLPDRYFASMDAVDVGNGNIVCRSEVDPNWTLDTYNSGSIFGTPDVATFTPGDGTCAPGNPFGEYNWSQESQDFFVPYQTQNDKVEQTVFSLIFTGDTGAWFELPGGPIGLAGGYEYRKEKSTSNPDAFEQAGYYFNSQTSPVTGSYSVNELFIEASAPILTDVPFARELTIDAAYRYSDYDLEVGKTNTYSFGFGWAPIQDIRFRGTSSRAVRAPNIFELFSPQTGATFNLDIDPCDQGAIDSLALSDPATAANRAANCASDPLVGPGFQNPLTSNFPGVRGGNPELVEETSDTITLGAVILPRFAEGLSITVDYFDVEIKDAVQQVTGEDILRGCYDGQSLDPIFCELFTRIDDTSSGFFGGLNFLQTGQINFAALQSSGYDMEVIYNFDMFAGDFEVRANATYLDELVLFRSALDPTLADDEKGEMQRPEWAGNLSFRYGSDRWSVRWGAQYMGDQLHRTIEANEEESFDNARSGTLWMHTLSGVFQISDNWRINAGVNNVTDEQPFATQPAFPAGVRGRYFFGGVTLSL